MRKAHPRVTFLKIYHVPIQDIKTDETKYFARHHLEHNTQKADRERTTTVPRTASCRARPFVETVGCGRRGHGPVARRPSMTGHFLEVGKRNARGIESGTFPVGKTGQEKRANSRSGL